MAPRKPDFDGKTYDAAKDKKRLTGQLAYVEFVMADRHWRTFDEIRTLIRGHSGKLPSEASISARLRDLRKPQFGGYLVERRRRAPGLHEYRVIKKESKTLFD